jgi:hypothetical protein
VNETGSLNTEYLFIYLSAPLVLSCVCREKCYIQVLPINISQIYPELMFITQEEELLNPTVLWGRWSDFKLWGGGTNTEKMQWSARQITCMQNYNTPKHCQ